MRFKPSIYSWIFAACSVYFSLSGCTSKSSSSTLETPDSEIAKIAWYQKARHVLLSPNNPKSIDLRTAVKGKSREQLVDEILDSREFADTVLDFNLYYLGAKRDLIRSESSFDNEQGYNDYIYNYPGAINSAREVIYNDNYYSLFHFTQPKYEGSRINFGSIDEKIKFEKIIDPLNAIHQKLLDSE